MRLCCALICLPLLAGAADAPRAQRATFSVLSWNVSGMPPVEQADSFRGHLGLASPDILLLDEVEGKMSEQEFRRVLGNPQAGSGGWQILWGRRGGRQRIVIAAQSPLDAIDAFQNNAYDAAEIDAVLSAAPADAREGIRTQMADGIPVNAARLTVAGKRLLVVAVDLQCCGGEWQQVRRLAEARHIRRLVDEAIRTSRPDGVILAGDLNLAAPPPARAGIGAVPLVVLSGPYAAPVYGLIAAEATQLDGREVWTISGGDNSPFPLMPFDFQLYSAHSLSVVTARIIDTADYPSAELKARGLTPTSSREFSDHLPVVVTYEWSARR